MSCFSCNQRAREDSNTEVPEKCPFLGHLLPQGSLPPVASPIILYQFFYYFLVSKGCPKFSETLENIGLFPTRSKSFRHTLKKCLIQSIPATIFKISICERGIFLIHSGPKLQISLFFISFTYVQHTIYYILIRHILITQIRIHSYFSIKYMSFIAIRFLYSLCDTRYFFSNTISQTIKKRSSNAPHISDFLYQYIILNTLKKKLLPFHLSFISFAKN